MNRIRQPAVAGMFYPDDPEALRAMIGEFLDRARPQGPVPKAMIAPHAGYIYSGPVAASAYARLTPARETIQRVVLLGPAHRVPFRGLAASSARAFATPLGTVDLDHEAMEQILQLPQVQIMDEAHRLEHSLEVHIPFLQQVLESFKLVPLVVGDAAPQEVDEVLETLWGGPETLLVISSDLSHYNDYDTARALDTRTSEAIEALDPAAIEYDQACGRNPVNGLLVAARTHGLHASTLDLRSSGDTAGPRDQVVGYGAYVFE